MLKRVFAIVLVIAGVLIFLQLSSGTKRIHYLGDYGIGQYRGSVTANEVSGIGCIAEETDVFGVTVYRGLPVVCYLDANGQPIEVDRNSTGAFLAHRDALAQGTAKPLPRQGGLLRIAAIVMAIGCFALASKCWKKPDKPVTTTVEPPPA
jgi:hypothetical protein